MSSEDIVNIHDTLMKSLGIELSDDDKRLPYLYADDSNLANADRLLKVAQDKLNADLERLEKMLYLNKLTPNIDKTEYMIIATSPKLKSLSDSPLIKLSGKPIKRVLKSDYLGLIVDEKLSWAPYTKMSSAVMAMKQVSFLSRRPLLTLYHSLVESRLRCCNTVWRNCGNRKKNNNPTTSK